jgi:asparagine synthase (glutamine-hydrolysing)
MGASIEGRVPFLDHRVAELALSIDGRCKFHGVAGNKWMLRRLAQRHLPPSVAERKKQGFPNQLRTWFVPARLPAIRDRLLGRGGFARSFFPMPWLEAALADATALQLNELTVHSLLVLDAWHRTFIDDHRTNTQDPPRRPVVATT